MRSIIRRLLGVLAGLTLLVSVAAVYFARVTSLKSPASFTIRMTETFRKGDGFHVKHVIYGYKSDGSLAKWDERDWGNGPVIVKTVRDVQSRQAVTYESTLKSKMTLPLSEEDIRKVQTVRGTCVEPEPGITVEAERFLGFDVIKKTEVLTNEAAGRERRLEVWLAPELNCTSVKYVVSKPAPDSGWTVEAHGEATSITLGEPDPRLFDLPTDYSELPPVETFSELRKLHGRAPVPPSPGELKMQQKYYESRK